MEWIYDLRLVLKTDMPVLVYCPEWCASEYQVATYAHGKFAYDEAPNDDFNDYVVAWSIFMEAD